MLDADTEQRKAEGLPALGEGLLREVSSRESDRGMEVAGVRASVQK